MTAPSAGIPEDLRDKLFLLEAFVVRMAQCPDSEEMAEQYGHAKTALLTAIAALVRERDEARADTKRLDRLTDEMQGMTASEWTNIFYDWEIGQTLRSHLDEVLS